MLIGAGWIGAEVATAALKAECRVTCLECGAAPLAGPLGLEMADVLPWWSDVELRTGVRVAAIETEGVRLEDGELVPADLVVTGVGVRPEAGWLAGSDSNWPRAGWPLTHGRTSHPSVYAVGDLASRWSDRLAARVHSGTGTKPSMARLP